MEGSDESDERGRERSGSEGEGKQNAARPVRLKMQDEHFGSEEMDLSDDEAVAVREAEEVEGRAPSDDGEPDVVEMEESEWKSRARDRSDDEEDALEQNKAAREEDLEEQGDDEEVAEEVRASQGLFSGSNVNRTTTKAGRGMSVLGTMAVSDDALKAQLKLAGATREYTAKELYEILGDLGRQTAKGLPFIPTLRKVIQSLVLQSQVMREKLYSFLFLFFRRIYEKVKDGKNPELVAEVATLFADDTAFENFATQLCGAYLNNFDIVNFQKSRACKGCQSLPDGLAPGRTYYKLLSEVDAYVSIVDAEQAMSQGRRERKKKVPFGEDKAVEAKSSESKADRKADPECKLAAGTIVADVKDKEGTKAGTKHVVKTADGRQLFCAVQIGQQAEALQRKHGACLCRTMVAETPRLLELVVEVAVDLGTPGPTEQSRVVSSGSRIAADFALLAEAQRMLKHLQLSDSVGALTTDLTPSFIHAQMSFMIPPLLAHFEAEHNVDLRALKRVFVELIGMQDSGDGMLVCEVIPRKILKQCVEEAVWKYFLTKLGGTNFIGYTMRLDSSVRLRYVGGGFAAAEKADDDLRMMAFPCPPGELTEYISSQNCSGFVSVVLRGLKDAKDMTLEKFRLASTRVLIVSFDDLQESFENALRPPMYATTEDGSLTRLFFSCLWKYFRAVGVVATTRSWARKWEMLLKNDKRTVHVLHVCESAGQGDFHVPSAAWLMASDRTAVDVVAGVSKWHSELSRLARHGKKEAEEEEAAEAEAAKVEGGNAESGDEAKPKSRLLDWDVQQFFHESGASFHLAVTDDMFEDENDAEAAADPKAASLNEFAVAKEKAECVFDPSKFAIVPGFSTVPTGHGVMVRDEDFPREGAFSVKPYILHLEEFIASASDPNVLSQNNTAFRKHLDDSESLLALVAGLPKFAPFTVSRWLDQKRVPFIVLHAAQDMKDGRTLATDGGSSTVARFAHFAGGALAENFFTVDVLPYNYNWSYPIDFNCACAACRPVHKAAQEKRVELGKPGIPINFPTKPACANCLVRYNAVCAWLDWSALLHVRMATFLAEKVLFLPWGKQAQTVWERIARTMAPWMKHVEVASKPLPHMNAVAYMTNAGSVSAARRGIASAVDDIRFISRLDPSNARETVVLTRQQRRQFYAVLILLHNGYDPKTAVKRLAEATKKVRPIVDSTVQDFQTGVRCILGLEQSQLVDLQKPVVRFFVQLALEALVLKNEDGWKKFEGSSARKKKSSVAAAATGVSLKRRDVKRFVRETRGLLASILALPTAAAVANAAKLTPGWRRDMLHDFEKRISELIDPLWRNRSDPSARMLLEQTITAGSLTFMQKNHIAFGSILPTFASLLDSKAVADLVKRKSWKPSTKGLKKTSATVVAASATFLFTPKRPKVVIVPSPSLSLSHIHVTPIVASEIIGRALRLFLAEANVAAFKGFTRDDLFSVASSVLTAALDRQQRHFKFRKSAVDDFWNHLLQLVDELPDGGYKYVVNTPGQPFQVGEKKEFFGRTDFVLAALFDFASLVSATHLKREGASLATTNGDMVNLVATLKCAASTKRKAGNTAATNSKLAENDLAAVRAGELLFGGIDIGKSGIDAVMPNPEVQAAMARLAFAEGQLERARVAKSGDTETLRAAVDAARISTDEAIKLVYGNGKRGVERGASSITKDLHQMEMLSTVQERERHQQLAIAGACLVSGVTVQSLLERRIKFFRIPVGSELAVVRDRLRDARLLLCIHNAPAVVQQRRERVIRERQIVARSAHLLAVELPKQVLAAKSAFPATALPFPAKSSTMRAKEKIRGWERGVHVAEANIARANLHEEAKKQPLPRVVFAIDTCPGKGQRTTSGFPFRSHMTKIIKFVQAHASLRSRVTFQHINGNHFRSSAQASGLVNWLSKDGERVDMRRVQQSDLPSTWKGPLPKDFYVKFDKVTGTIKRRDPPAALTVSRNAIGAHFGAPTPPFLKPLKSSRRT